MNKIEDVLQEKTYEKDASAFSKMIIFVFIGSFIYLVATNSEQIKSWIIAIIFLVVGIFLSSILIAMPLFFIMKKFPKMTLIVDVGSAILTFF